MVSMEHWTHYPSFAVLRLKNTSEQERKAIADKAREQMTGIPYHLTAGIWKENAGTQCAHLVWYAYHQFGYDLDSDGVLIVTPRDLYDSPLLEVIQIYGMPIVPEG